MVTGPKPSISKVIRHEANIILAIDGRTFEIESNGFNGTAQAALIQPGTKHIVKADQQRVVRVAIHPIHPRFRGVVKHVRPDIKVMPREEFAHLDAVLQAAAHVGVSAEVAGRTIESALDVVMRGVPPPEPIDPRVMHAMRRLDADINTPFDSLAAELGLSASRLSHLFTDQVGLSFRNLQNWGRLRLAWELVAWHPEMTLTEIAHVMGFADSSHLSRAFNKGLGMTPTMIRSSGYLEVIGRKMPAGQHVPPDNQMLVQPPPRD